MYRLATTKRASDVIPVILGLWVVAYSRAPALAQGSASQQTKTLSIVLNQLPWQSTGVQVAEGDLIDISASGDMNWYTPGLNGNGCPKLDACHSTPDGKSCPYPRQYPSLPCWSLIGKIGAGEPFFVGSSLTLTAAASGELLLAVNDDFYPDNTGEWTAAITTLTSTCAAPTGTTSQTADASGKMGAIADATSSRTECTLGRMLIQLQRDPPLTMPASPNSPNALQREDPPGVLKLELNSAVRILPERAQQWETSPGNKPFPSRLLPDLERAVERLSRRIGQATMFCGNKKNFMQETFFDNKWKQKWRVDIDNLQGCNLRD
jgi:hypothetical protein